MSKQLVFIGDSLTQWFDWQRRFPRYQVTNLGISGERVEGLIARRELIRAQIGRPDFIFLMTGINNIANGEQDIEGPYREIVRNLTTWYKDSKVVVQSILPTALEWISNNAISDANRTIREIVRDYRAEYLDIYGVFVDSRGNPRSGFLSDDGVHLGRKGYEAWADEIEHFLQGQGS